MSRKQDPIVGVMTFFESASLGAAQTALALAKAIVKKRTPAEKVKKTRRRTRKDAERPAMPPSTPPPMPDVVQPGQPVASPNLLKKARRQRALATPASTAGSAARSTALDLALPGLGPSTVGE